MPLSPAGTKRVPTQRNKQPREINSPDAAPQGATVTTVKVHFIASRTPIQGNTQLHAQNWTLDAGGGPRRAGPLPPARAPPTQPLPQVVSSNAVLPSRPPVGRAATLGFSTGRSGLPSPVQHEAPWVRRTAGRATGSGLFLAELDTLRRGSWRWAVGRAQSWASRAGAARWE